MIGNRLRALQGLRNDFYADFFCNIKTKHVPRSRDFDQNFGVQITKKKRGYGVRFWAFLSIASSDSVRLQKVMGSFWKNGQNFIDLNFCKI